MATSCRASPSASGLVNHEFSKVLTKFNSCVHVASKKFHESIRTGESISVQECTHCVRVCLVILLNLVITR